MAKTNFLKNLAHQLTDALPTHLGILKKDFEKNCHSILSKAFHKFDLSRVKNLIPKLKSWHARVRN